MAADLKRASRLYRSGRYPQVIRLLEPQVFRYRQNHLYYYLIGMACLQTGDLGGAATYLKRSVDLKDGNRDAHLGLAIIHLKRHELSVAIQYLLTILDEDPGDRRARKILSIVQKYTGLDQTEVLSESPRLIRLLRTRTRFSKSLLLIPAAILIMAIGTYAFRHQIVGLFSRDSARSEEAAFFDLRDIDDIVATGGDHRIILTEDEIRRVFRDAKLYFSSYRDNLSLREINRLLISNASLPVKEQARTLKGLITPPDFTTITDSFEYQEVVANPLLYDQCYIVWSGKISNLEITTEMIRFDFLVGYERNTVLEGIVPVVLDFAATLESGMPLEVLGEVSIQVDDSISIRGISIHKLAPE